MWGLPAQSAYCPPRQELKDEKIANDVKTTQLIAMMQKDSTDPNGRVSLEALNQIADERLNHMQQTIYRDLEGVGPERA